MLKKLDRYIIRKFLTTFFFTVLIFTLISVVIDFSEKIEKFIESGITREEIIFSYYPGFIFFIAGKLWPLFTLIAVIFFTSRMAFNSEIISILNAGISFRRLMVPYLFSAGFLALLLFIGNHSVIPARNKVRMDIEHQYIHTNEDKGQTENVHFFLSPNSKVYIKSFRKRDSTARDFHLERFDDNRLEFLLKARYAEWKGPPDNWLLRDYEMRKFNGLEEEYYLGYGEQLDTNLNLTPADFVDYKNQQQMMTTKELREYIASRKARGLGNTRKYALEMHNRYAEPVTIFILTIIGLAIAARKIRGGIGLHLALGIGLGAIYIFLSRFAIVFAQGQAIPIVLGIWTPNIIFGLVAFYLIRRAQK
ncbi:MAG: LptF/LptG family permease [Balneolaceae bacterium]|nr:LptF/LptG family permease [Balneolaceae bacterium]